MDKQMSDTNMPKFSIQPDGGVVAHCKDGLDRGGRGIDTLLLYAILQELQKQNRGTSIRLDDGYSQQTDR